MLSFYGNRKSIALFTKTIHQTVIFIQLNVSHSTFIFLPYFSLPADLKIFLPLRDPYPNLIYIFQSSPMWYVASSSSYICHGVGPLVDPFRSYVSRSLFIGLPWFLLPTGKYCFITLGNLLRGILFTYFIQFLLFPVICPKSLLFLIPLQFVYLFCNLSKCILLFFSCISSLLLLFFWRPLL